MLRNTKSCRVSTINKEKKGVSDRIIAIHQPNFIPWAGYFLKMVACDVFVFHDNVQITKAGPTRRVKISAQHTTDHTQWLTVPRKKHSDFAIIKDIEIFWELDWTKHHLSQIREEYRKSQYFNVYFPDITEWYQNARQFTSLSDMNIYFAQRIMEVLGLKKEILLSSQLPVFGKASEYNCALTMYLGGTHYLSGKGGDKYQDESIFRSNHIELLKLDAKNYLEQQFSDYNINCNLSILEMLMKVDIDIIKGGFSTVKI